METHYHLVVFDLRTTKALNVAAQETSGTLGRNTAQAFLSSSNRQANDSARTFSSLSHYASGDHGSLVVRRTLKPSRQGVEN